jgi:hypothetical protein
MAILSRASPPAVHQADFCVAHAEELRSQESSPTQKPGLLAAGKIAMGNGASENS